MKPSKFLSLNARDFLRSLIIAIGTPTLGYVVEALNQGSWDIDWKNAGIIAAAAGCTYLLKNLFTPTVNKNDQ